MIYFVTGRTHAYDWSLLRKEGIVYGSFDEFVHWSHNETKFGLDTETTMVKDGPNAHDDRELLVLQLGNEEDQWVIDMIDLPDYWISKLKVLLSDESKTYFVHNARFDYVVLYMGLGIKVEGLHDTFLMSKILNTGIETYPGYHSLAGCLKRFFDIEMSKDAQTTFTGEPLSLNQITYSAIDVIMLESLFEVLKAELKKWKLWYLYDSVERHVMKAYCDMELNPMRFDRDYWSDLAVEFDKEDVKIEKELNEYVLKDPLLVNYLKNSEQIINVPLIQPHEQLFIKWASPVHKKKILSLLVPSLPDTATTKPKIKKFLKENRETLPESDIDILELYMDRKYSDLNDYLVTNYYDWLITNELLIKEGTIRINWASNVHKLLIFQFYYPKLKDTSSGSLARISKNELITKYKEYSKIHKTVTTYGSKFIEKYVKRDGTIAPTKLSQILSTGRVAFGILLQMPGQAKFRNGFLPPEKDWVFVDSDYSSAELAIMAHLSGEESLLDVVRTGKDAHMFVAQKLFPTEWNDAAEPGCIQLTTGVKCNCPGHEKLRKSGKAFNFGIPYGMTHMGLADRLDKSKTEAKAMMDDYFKTFTKLKVFFDKAEKDGQENLYIRGAQPTGRIRFFEHPAHDQDLQAIGREAKNLQIQECNASMLKIAIMNLRYRILEEDLPAKLHLPVHDEILSSCHKDFAEDWKKIQEEEMMKAADLFLEQGLLGVDTDILERWTK
jgi:DNA polymerase I-like protein with 3'-5' exonuclease and polymerase domains